VAETGPPKEKIHLSRIYSYPTNRNPPQRNKQNGAKEMIQKHLARIVPVVMIQVCILSVSLLITHPAQAGGDSPTQEIVEKALKSRWDKSATSVNPKSTLTLNGVKFGKAYKATLQEVQVEGIPEKVMVTPAVVDFTVRTYYTNETQAVRRVREARVYKDKMDEWAVMTGAVKGQDTTTKEPAAR
jgi:hypothetical protein